MAHQSSLLKPSVRLPPATGGVVGLDREMDFPDSVSKIHPVYALPVLRALEGGELQHQEEPCNQTGQSRLRPCVSPAKVQAEEGSLGSGYLIAILSRPKGASIRDGLLSYQADTVPMSPSHHFGNSGKMLCSELCQSMAITRFHIFEILYSYYQTLYLDI